ncbi:MAG TPA: hypothetical protein VKE70_28090 [Candidatus Solibacter sp.]|nr:hypothetical protein [Candidatus Solibacter sp.]
MSDQDLNSVWEFGVDQAPMIGILAADWLLTLLHSLQELIGKLWCYFGAIRGVKIPDRFGFAVFFGGLTVLLWAVGFLGIRGAVLFRMEAPFFLGLLIGCRVSDGIFSHILPHLKQYRRNPGLTTVPFYFAEALFLSWAFYPALSGHPLGAVSGFALGTLLFYIILPGLPILGRLFKFKPQAKWLRGTPRPSC